MGKRCELFDRERIDEVVWPESEEGRFARKFYVPLIKNGIENYIDNIRAEISLLQIDHYLFPIITAEKNYTNSFICSPYGQYIEYAKHSVGLIENPFFEALTKNVLSGLGFFFRLGKINSVVYVNHSLFSTDLYPEELSEEQIAEIVKILQERFPGHAIIFRSINPSLHTNMAERIKKQKFHLIASRHVYIANPKNESMFQSRTVKRDLKLWREHSYEILDETKVLPEEHRELLNLYNSLYIDEHSHLNPQYNQEFMKLLFEERLLHFKILKKGGCIKGMAGYFISHGIMQCPLFGYDKQDPDQSNIYRLLNTAMLLEAKKRGVLINQGSGASSYKLNRRAEGCFDYLAVYYQHLSYQQKLAWATLKTFINAFAPKFMKKY